MIENIRIDTEGLRNCANDVLELRRFTSEITDHINNAQILDLEREWDYQQCLRTTGDIARCFKIMHDLLLDISDDTENTLRKISALTEESLEIV